VILILGAGFLGLNLYKHFTKLDVNVKLFSRKLPDDLRKYPNTEGDIESIINWQELLKDVETIVHCIHTTVPANSDLHQAYDIQSNVIPLLALTDACHKFGVKNLVYISSGGAVYGKQIGNGKTDETQHCYPKSSYGITKLMNEHYLRVNKEKFINSIIIRPSNIYGIGQNLNKPQGIIGHLIHSIKSEMSIEIWGDGNSIKDYLHISDFCEAIYKVVNSTENLQGYDIYNLASNQCISVNEIIAIIEGFFNKRIKREYLPFKEFDVRDVQLSSLKFMKKFKWKAQRDVYREIEELCKNTE